MEISNNYNEKIYLKHHNIIDMLFKWKINKQLFTSKRLILFFKPGNSVNTATWRYLNNIIFNNQII